MRISEDMILRGDYLRKSWGNIGKILRKSWVKLGEILGKYWGNLGGILGKSWRILGEILWKSRGKSIKLTKEQFNPKINDLL